MDEPRIRAEQLLTLSGAARRLTDFVVAADRPLRYEVIRHLLRMGEETMTEVLDEAVAARLIARGPDPHTYIPYDEATAEAVRWGIDDERLARLRGQIEGATRRVFDTDGSSP